MQLKCHCKVIILREIFGGGAGGGGWLIILLYGLIPSLASGTRVDIKFSIHACWAGLRETAGSSVGSTMAIECLLGPTLASFPGTSFYFNRDGPD